MKWKSCLTCCDPMDYTVRKILQARILEWVAFPFSRGSSQPRDQTQVSRIAGRFFTNWTTREALKYTKNHFNHFEAALSIFTSLFQNFLISQAWTPHPLNNNFPFPSPLGPGNHPSTFYLWTRLLEVPHINGIMQYLSFCVWILLLSIMSSSFIHVVANGRISFLFKLNNIPLHVYTEVFLVIHPLISIWVAFTF